MSKCQSSFCEIYDTNVQKNKKNEKFYGCEKLYFTELLYERKRKARDRKENFTIAPLQSCFVTVSVFVVISVGVPQYRGTRNRSRVCATPPPLTSALCLNDLTPDSSDSAPLDDQ